MRVWSGRVVTRSLRNVRITPTFACVLLYQSTRRAPENESPGGALLLHRSTPVWALQCRAAGATRVRLAARAALSRRDRPAKRCVLTQLSASKQPRAPSHPFSPPTSRSLSDGEHAICSTCLSLGARATCLCAPRGADSWQDKTHLLIPPVLGPCCVFPVRATSHSDDSTPTSQHFTNS